MLSDEGVVFLKNALLTNEQILATTENLLRQNGVTKTAVTDVAKALNVSHATIYNYFPNKKTLLAKATENWLQVEIINHLKDIPSKADTLSVEQHLYRYIDMLIKLKRKSAAKDSALFAIYAKVTVSETKVLAHHIHQIHQHLTLICQRHLTLADEPCHNLARFIFSATSKFHHPAHANEWLETAQSDADFANVWAHIQPLLNSYHTR